MSAPLSGRRGALRWSVALLPLTMTTGARAMPSPDAALLELGAALAEAMRVETAFFQANPYCSADKADAAAEHHPTPEPI